MRHVILSHESASANEIGAKAAALAALADAGLSIPPWFAVAPTASNPAALELDREIEEALAALCPDGAPVAVRSSAPEEDGAEHSFAGLLDSYLHVPAGDVARRVKDVQASAAGARALAYRGLRGLVAAPRPAAALVQRMVDAEASGVAFGADPVSGRRDIAVVSAVRGLGTLLVGGTVAADTWDVDRAGLILRRVVAEKRSAHVRAPGPEGGVETVTLSDEEALRPALSDEQVVAVAQMARKAGRRLGRPQDVEWALAGGRLFLLQSRPVTGLPPVDPAGAPLLWDDSNIAESYGGVTCALTFSFLRRAYEEVYRAFARTMGVPARVVEENQGTFRGMLGFLRGRVRYNLLHWYRVVSLLPGYAWNARFFEEMLGVRESIPEALRRPPPRRRGLARLADALRAARSAAAILCNLVVLPLRISRWRRRLDEALAPGPLPLADLRADELVARYRDLERRLLTRWDVPIVNDFFAMVSHGLLRRSLSAWVPEGGAAASVAWIGGAGRVISAEPAAEVAALSALLGENPGLRELLAGASAGEIRRGLEGVPEIARRCHVYLERFGDRCPEELKLESTTLHDDPLPFFRALADAGVLPALAARSPRPAPIRPLVPGFHPVRRAILRVLRRTAQRRLATRENLRFDRMRLFASVRRIFVELGGRLHAAGALQDPRDVFDLEVEEVLGWVEGTSTCRDLGALAALRREERRRWQLEPAPPSRFVSRGIADPAFAEAPDRPLASRPTGSRRCGLGLSAGVMRGRVRVVEDPRSTAFERGEILVARRTDPGWILLFSRASALLVERGSLLSHVAIVARELGVPAVTGVPGLMEWLADGDEVEVDGGAGVVRRLARAADRLEAPSAGAARAG